MQTELIIADYHNPVHGQQILRLLDAYARDPMGGGRPLQPQVKLQLLDALGKVPGAFSLICYRDDEAVGLMNCFESFSTFLCAPIINIHDVYVQDRVRGTGLCQLMLDEVETIARQRGCCKITLEVLEGNSAARRAYRKHGFSDYQLDPQAGKALFWQKLLAD